MHKVSIFVSLLTVISLLPACHRPASSSFSDTETEEVQRLAVTSCTHIGFLNALGALDKVVAVCNRDLIYTPLPDSVIDLGDAMTPNMELLLQADVDAVLVSTYTQDKMIAQMQDLGLRVIPINEWQETTPLGRAAWIKTIGDVVGRRHEADSIYESVAECYERIHSAQSSTGPLLMTGNNFRGTWYVPAGHTYMGQLIADAGARYPYLTDTREQSIPLTLEQVLVEFREAEVWIGSSGRSLNELKQMDDKHTWFRAYHNGRVWNWLKQSTPSGANNFWERGAVHPEEVLEDIIRILQDEPCADSLHYALRLE